MGELVALLSVYYSCTALAEAGVLSQSARFECNDTYQETKRLFLGDDLGHAQAALTAEQNTLAYLRFKQWEAENADLVQALRRR